MSSQNVISESPAATQKGTLSEPVSLPRRTSSSLSGKMRKIKVPLEKTKALVFPKKDEEENPKFSDIFLKTEVNGLADWYEAGNILSKIIWTIIVIGAFALMIAFLIETVNDFRKSPILTEYNVVSSPEGMLFPAVYICPSYPIHRQWAMEARIDTDWIEEHAKGVLGGASLSSSKTGNETAGLLAARMSQIDTLVGLVVKESADNEDYCTPGLSCGGLPAPAAGRIEAPKNFVPKEDEPMNTCESIKDYFFIVGHRAKDLFRECAFNGKRINCVQHVTEIFDASYGKCFLFSTKGKRQTTPGLGLSLVLDLDVKRSYPNIDENKKQPLFDGVAVKFGNSKYSGKSTGIGPVTASGHIEVNMGTLTRISLERKMVQLLQYDHFHSEAHCTKNEDGAKELKVLRNDEAGTEFSATVCILDCSQQAVVNRCNCHLPIDQRFIQDLEPKRLTCSKHETVSCGRKALNESENKDLANCIQMCKKPCEVDELSYSTTSSQYPPRRMKPPQRYDNTYLPHFKENVCYYSFDPGCPDEHIRPVPPPARTTPKPLEPRRPPSPVSTSIRREASPPLESSLPSITGDDSDQGFGDLEELLEDNYGDEVNNSSELVDEQEYTIPPPAVRKKRQPPPFNEEEFTLQLPPQPPPKYKTWYWDMEKNDCLKADFYPCYDGTRFEINKNKFISKYECLNNCAETGHKCLSYFHHPILKNFEAECPRKTTRYYYHRKLKQCRRFSFTGCNANRNMYNTKESCESACAEYAKDDVCFDTVESGWCFISMVAYDQRENSCQFHTNLRFDKCSENSTKNNFADIQDCRTKCILPLEKHKECLENIFYDGHCDAENVYFFNDETGKCETLEVRPGCARETKNKFKNYSECQEKCELKYNVALSNANTSSESESHQNFNTIGTVSGIPSDLMRDDIIVLEIAFARLQYVEIEQKNSMTFTTFVSNIGGHVGLWVGLSIVTMIKALLIVLTICLHKVRNRDRKSPGTTGGL